MYGIGFWKLKMENGFTMKYLINPPKIKQDKYYICDIISTYNADGWNGELNFTDIVEDQCLQGSDIGEWGEPVRNEDADFIVRRYHYLSGLYDNKECVSGE